MVLEISSLSQLRQYTSDSTKIVVIDFYADWCGPCKHVAPMYATLSDTFERSYGNAAANAGVSVVFLKCNVDRARDVAQAYSVKSMPTFIFIHDGKVIEQFAGADIGRVERVAKDNLLYIAQQRRKSGAAGTGGHTLGSGSGGNSSATAAAVASPDPHRTGLLNAPARYFVNISAAIQAKKDAAEIDQLVRDLHTFLKSQTGGQATMPLGSPLIPFLVMSDNDYYRVANDPFNVFLATLVRLGKEQKEEAARSKSGQGGSKVVCKDGVCSLVPDEEAGDNANNAHSSAANSRGGSLPALIGGNWAFTDQFTFAEDATAIVVNIARIAVNALTFETWNVVGANNVTAHTVPNPQEQQMQRFMPQNNNGNDKKAAPPAPYTGRWHTLLLRLLRSEVAQSVLFSPGAAALAAAGSDAVSLVQALHAYATPSPLIHSRWMKTGKQLELNTILGALLSPGFFPARATVQSQQIQTLAMLHPSALTGQGMDRRTAQAEVEGHTHVFTTQVQNEMDAHTNRCYPIFRELLGKKGAVRTNVLLWLQQFFAANAGFTRQNREKSELCSDSAMFTLANVLVELALPITGANGFEKTIPTDYYSDLNAFATPLPAAVEKLASAFSNADGTTMKNNAALCDVLLTRLNTRTVVQFGLSRSDVERVCHFKPLKDDVLNNAEAVEAVMASLASLKASGNNNDTDNAAIASSSGSPVDIAPADATDAFPLPVVDTKGSGDALPETLQDALAQQGVNHYAPRIHIFFMALRAVHLSTTTTLSTIKSLTQQMDHPRTNARDAGFLQAMIAVQKAMLMNDTWARKTVQFLNGAARWLLHILGADRETGALPKVVPDAWKLMPQQVIDEVLTAMTLVTKHNVRSLHPSDIDDIISLLLVLMGNLTYFPKAHTHALFPTVILELLGSQMFAPALTRHRWFQSNIVLGCIRTYIAMEKCYYDKTSCRYYLSVCLKRFLNEDVLCYSARQVLQDTTGRTLEKFTHMVTTEANQAIDDVLTALAQMRKLEAEGKDVIEDRSTVNSNFNTNANNNANNGRARRNRRREGNIYQDSDEDSAEESENDDAINTVGGGTSNQNVAAETYPQVGEKLKNGLLIFSETIVVFKLLSRQFQDGVLQHMVAQQISNMLVQNISKLAGKNSAELKVKNPDTWGFNPRGILESLVECFVHFRREKVFIGCVLESMHSVSTPETFNYAIRNITNPSRTLVLGSLAAELREMHDTINKANVGRDLEEQIWDDDAPEWAFCALMSTPLKDPVALPMHGDELLFVERDVIRHRLLELEENPFSREKLSEEQLNAHNNLPEVRKAVEELKRKIAAYAAEKKAQLLAKE